MGLHVEDDAGVGFGQSVSVGDTFTGESQLHFGQTGTAEQTQRVSRWLIDVTHGGGGTGSLQREDNGGQWVSTEKPETQPLIGRQWADSQTDTIFVAKRIQNNDMITISIEN